MVEEFKSEIVSDGLKEGPGTNTLLQNLETNVLSQEIKEKLDNLKNFFGDKIALKQGFLSVDPEKTKDIREKSVGFMEVIGSVFNIPVPLIGTLGGAFGMKWPIDFIRGKKKKKRPMIDKLLKTFGIKGGLEELHRDYIENNLRGIDHELLKTTFQKYKELEDNGEGESDLWAKLALESQAIDLNEEQKGEIKSKLPNNLEHLQISLSDFLDGDISTKGLNISIVSMVGQEFLEVGANNSVTGINYQKIQENKSDFINKYLQVIIPKLAFSGEDFIASPNCSKDSFALAVFGCLLGEKFFMEGVNLGLITVDRYKALVTEKKQNDSDKEDGDKVDRNKVDILTEDKEKRMATISQAEYFVEKGIDYGWGQGHGVENNGLDCSGLVIASMRRAGMESPGGDSRAMFQATKTQRVELDGDKIKALEGVNPGDLLFWNSTNPKYQWTKSKIPEITKNDIKYRIHHVAFVKSINYETGMIDIIESNGSNGVVARPISAKQELLGADHKSELYVGSIDYDKLEKYNGLQIAVVDRQGNRDVA